MRSRDRYRLSVVGSWLLERMLKLWSWCRLCERVEESLGHLTATSRSFRLAGNLQHGWTTSGLPIVFWTWPIYPL